MARTHLRLDTRRALKDGTFPVKIRIGYGTNVYINTNIYLTPREWDVRTELCTGCNAGRTNAVLSQLLRRTAARVLDLRESGLFYTLAPSQLREMLRNPALKEPAAGVPSLQEMFCRVLEGKRGSTHNIMEHALKKVEAFAGGRAVALNEITRSWLEGFETSLKHLSVNTRAAYMRNLRQVMNRAADEGLVHNLAFRHYKIRSAETDMRVLPVEVMRRFANARLEGKSAEYRDVFMLCFYLIGINMKDLFNLTSENYAGGRIEYRRAKTGKLYSIKVEPEAAVILERYRGRTHLLGVFDKCRNHAEYLIRLNAALRRIGEPCREGKAKPFCAHVTSYYARYSWATYAADIDVPRDTISECLGHSYGARITGVYVKFSRDKIDAANRKVIDYLNGQ